MNYWGQLLTLIVAATMMRLAAEPGGDHSNPSPVAEGEAFEGLSPQRREWARKAVEGYIKKQEQKWQKWDEAMFIPSGSARQPTKNKK
jgi:hypothetical protein